MQPEINIQIVRITADRQEIIEAKLPQQSSIRYALHFVLQMRDLVDTPVGIFGKVRSLDHVLQEGDRIELYTPLLIDPKDARLERVKRDQKQKRKARHERLTAKASEQRSMRD